MKVKSKGWRTVDNKDTLTCVSCNNFGGDVRVAYTRNDGKFLSFDVSFDKVGPTSVTRR